MTDVKCVLHVITTIELGGAEKQLLTLCKSQLRQGLRVEVCFIKGKPELRSAFNEIGIVPFSLEGKTLIEKFLRFCELIRFLSPSVVHAHLPLAELFSVAAPHRFRFVVTRHNSEPFWPKGPRVISKFLSRIVLLRAKNCICISKSVMNFLQDSGEVTNVRKLSIVYYGFTHFSEPFPIPRRDFYPTLKILCVARLEKQKDLPTLFRAISELLRRDVLVELTIIGMGSSKVSLDKLSRDLQINDVIRWIPKTEQVDSYYRSHNVFVLSSLYEGFGQVYLESLMNGLPVISSRNEAAVEIFGKTYPGFFEIGNSFELANKLEDFVKGKILNLTENYRDIIASFDVNKMSQAIMDIYETHTL